MGFCPRCGHDLSAYDREKSRRGGEAGVGAAKRRPREHYQKAQAASAEARRRNKREREGGYRYQGMNTYEAQHMAIADAMKPLLAATKARQEAEHAELLRKWREEQKKGG